MHIHKKGKSSKVPAWKNTQSLESRCSSEYFWPVHDPRPIYPNRIHAKPYQIVCQQVPTKLGVIKYLLALYIYIYIHISQCVSTQNQKPSWPAIHVLRAVMFPLNPSWIFGMHHLKPMDGVSTQSRSNSRVTGVKCCAAAVMTIRPTWPLPHFEKGTHSLYTTEIAGNPHNRERERARDAKISTKARKQGKS